MTADPLGQRCILCGHPGVPGTGDVLVEWVDDLKFCRNTLFCEGRQRVRALLVQRGRSPK